MDSAWKREIMDKNRMMVLLIWILLVSTSFTIFFPFRGTIAGSEPVQTLDSTPPVADAGPDRTVGENESVLLDGSGSTDNVGIVNYTWTFLNYLDSVSYGMPEIRLDLPFQVTDAVFDPIRPYVYVSDYDNNKVHFINLKTSSIEKTFSVSLPPESVAINPNASALYVALLTRDHSPYWRDEEGHEGYIASFNLQTQAKETEFHINEDPYDMVATPDGFLVVSSGSGQWTWMRVYYMVDGTETGKYYSVRERTRISLDASGTRVYGSSYSALERYNYTPGGIQFKWRASRVNGHQAAGYSWGSPRGDVLFTSQGKVYSIGDTKETDMVFVKEMSGSEVTDMAFDTTTQIIFASQGHSLRFYDFDNNYTYLGTRPFGEEARFIGVDRQWVYGLLANGTGTRIAAIPHPMRCAFGSFVQHVFPGPGRYTVRLTVKDAAGNHDSDFVNVTVLDTTPPVADAGEDKTIIQGQSVLFDGRGSTDNTGIMDYTWTFNDGRNQILNGEYKRHYFNEPGVYNITLTVKDVMGYVGHDWLIVNVRPIQLVMHENAPKGFRIGIHPEWHVEIDQEVEDAGIADLVAYGPYVNSVRTNVIVASETGRVKETYTFLIEEAEEMIREISREVGTCDIVKSPEIIETAGSLAAVFEVQYLNVDIRQRIAIMVNETQSRMWAIIITTGLHYNETMSLTFDAIIESFEFVEPPFMSTPAGQGLIGALFSIFLGFLAGGSLYLWRKWRPEVKEEDDQEYADEERPMSEPGAETESSEEPAVPPNMFCANCGTELKSPYNFCTMCGSRSL